jgi:EAL domain-containing protein (putative c-di-GMP-specific phosphodiesterase class I)
VERCVAILSQRQHDGEPVRLFASQSLHGWNDAERRAQLAASLAAAGVSADTLVLEVRCEDVRANPAAWCELGLELKQAGVRLSLAGADMEAVTAGLIAHLPLDYVKLAPGLDDSGLEQVVRAAHAQELCVVAPRIETVARAEQLRAANVDLLQGNYFQPPVGSLDRASSDGGT